MNTGAEASVVLPLSANKRIQQRRRPTRNPTISAQNPSPEIKMYIHIYNNKIETLTNETSDDQEKRSHLHVYRAHTARIRNTNILGFSYPERIEGGAKLRRE